MSHFYPSAAILENGTEEIGLIPIGAEIALIGADKRGVRILAVHDREEHLVQLQRGWCMQNVGNGCRRANTDPETGR